MANVSKYILSKRIARGGMAEIFLAKAVDSDGGEQICAVKRILPHFAGEREYLEMFRSEAGICKRLVHPNIVRVFDFRSVDGNYAIIMEFVNGTDLRTLLAACEKSRIRLSVPMCIHLAVNVARGLHYAHSKIDDVSGQPMGIVHRDISPQNVLVSYDGEVKIIDFGIANFESKNLETKPGVVKGKYSYMSPEQVIAKRLDARSDIFSLSIILWEALSMKRLFAAETEVETIANVQNCLIKHNLKELNKNVDDDLMRIISKGLEKDRKYRYISAQAMEKDLQQYMEKKFSDFKFSDMGDLLKQILAVKRIETQQDIKKLISMSAAKALGKDAKAEPIDENQTKIKTVAAYQKKYPSSVNKKSWGGQAYSSSAAHQLTPQPANELASVNIPNPQQAQTMPQVTPTPTRRLSPAAHRHVNRAMKRKLNMQRLLYFKQMHSQKSQNNSFFAVIVGLVIALSTVVVFYHLRTKSMRGSVQFMVKTTPARVSLNLDGKPLFAGNYIRTPMKMALTPGAHKVVVSRQGYEPVTLKFKGYGGDFIKEENILLKENKLTTLVQVRIEDSAGKNIYIDVDKGLYTGKTPLLVKDFDSSLEHAVVVYPNYPKKTNAFKCSFQLKNVHAKVFSFTLFRGDGKRSPKCALGDQ